MNGNANNFTSVTPHMMNMMKTGMNNFQQSFKQNEPLIDPTDYKNRGHLLHNNLGETVLAEHVNEYNLYICSADRTICTYPSPFKFSVLFGVAGAGNG